MHQDEWVLEYTSIWRNVIIKVAQSQNSISLTKYLIVQALNLQLQNFMDTVA